MLAAVQVFNVSILALLRALGSVRTSLVGSCLVPLSIVAFTLPLPYLVRVPGLACGRGHGFEMETIHGSAACAHAATLA